MPARHHWLLAASEEGSVRLDELRRPAGDPLLPQLLEELKRLMVRHRLLSEQLREIEAAREQTAMAAEPDHAVQQIQMLTRLVKLDWRRRPG